LQEKIGLMRKRGAMTRKDRLQSMSRFLPLSVPSSIAKGVATIKRGAKGRRMGMARQIKVIKGDIAVPVVDAYSSSARVGTLEDTVEFIPVFVHSSVHI